MKKALLSLMAALFVCSMFVSAAFAAEVKEQGKIKSIDAAKGTMVFTSSKTKKDETLKAGADVTKGFKAGDPAIVTSENGTVKSIRKMITKVPVGC